MAFFCDLFCTFIAMNLMYNFTAHIVYSLLNIYGLFNKKIQLFVSGRKKTFEKLSILKNRQSDMDSCGFSRRV